MAGPTTAERAGRTAPSDRPRLYRTRLSRRGALLLLVAATVLAAGSAYVFYGSPWLRVRQVQVAGARTLTPDAVRAAAAVPAGSPLASVDTSAVAGRLRERLPRIASVDVTRSWPHTVVVKVTERTAKAVVKNGGKFIEVDSEGVRFATDSSAPSGVPFVELPEDAAASAGSPSNRYFGTDRLLHAAVQVAADLPESVQKQTQVIQVRSWDGITLQLTGNRTAVWGSAELGRQKATALVALMKAAHGATRYDVSVPSAPASSRS